MTNNLPIPTKKIFILAGEASGDHIGTSLMTAVKHLSPAPVIFFGVGGDGMKQQGLEPLFPMQDLNLMGIFEIIPSLRRIFKRLDQCVQMIKDQRPDCVVLIDTQDFSYRLAKRIKKLGIPCILYCVPTVWAWRRGRVKRYKKIFTELLALYPFEPSYFGGPGANCSFVGHPLFERLPQFSQAQQSDFYQNYNLDPTHPIMLLLPGSRKSEIKSLFPLFLESIEKIHQARPNIQFVLPTLDNLVPLLKNYLQPLHSNLLTIITNHDDKYLAISMGQTALAASGTISLELAFYGIPHLITYRVGALTAWIGRRLLTTPYANMINIISWHQNKENFTPIIPEFIQDQATVENIAPIALELLNPESSVMQHQKDQLQIILNQLRSPDNLPSSYVAAHRIIKYAFNAD